MTTVEKRRSGRKRGGRRKHSDGGYSDTSSCGSFLDENDREVSNLTDRAFRSLCIGDEAIYNDSDLSLSSPCTQRDRQLAFCQDREREELKRSAHENFSLRVQQYEQDWIHGGMYGAEIHRDPQWEVYGERTQGRVSATFQHSFVETSQQEKSLTEEQLSTLSNGASEVNSQQLRSRSRVSSLIRAFNSEGHRDVAGMDDRLREWNDEPSWDKSALMSIQRELSEFSTSYQQNFDSGHFPTAGPLSPPDANFYSSEVAAVAHMSHNSAAAFMRSSHSKHSMSAQFNCNSNFFIHSEFSPFKVWRDHNRFPFQHGQLSGFMHCSEFPKWYETPMYKELSLRDQPQAPFRGGRYSHLAPVVPPAHPRSTSTSTVMQKASAVEKRCESELAGHYPHRKRTQSLGANRLPSQRPSTASPTSDVSRCVRDTISSVKALQHKIQMMTEQNGAAGVIPNQHGGYYSNNTSLPFGNNAGIMVPNVVSSSTTSSNMSQMLTPSANAHRDADSSDLQHYELSAPPVEHAPVRAESRGATPDVRMSSYRSRASSLLFNLKDNRKRVKSTYSPPKFKGLDTQEKNRRPSAMEPRETVIDIPDFVDPYNQFPPLDESNRTNAAASQYANHYQSSMLNSFPAPTHAGQYAQYMYDDQTAQMQGQMVHHSGLTGFIPENYPSNQLTNGQNPHQDLASFAPYMQGGINNVGSLGGDIYRLHPSTIAAETSKLNAENNQGREYLLRQTHAEQPETFGTVHTNVDRYEHLSDNQQGYNDAFSQDRHRQTYSQDTEKLSMQAHQSTFKQESATFMEKTRQGNQPSTNKEVEQAQLKESFAAQTSSHNISNQLQQCAVSNDIVGTPAYYEQQQSLAFQHQVGFQKFPGHYEDNQMKDSYKIQNDNRYTDQEYRGQHAHYPTEDRLIAMQPINTQTTVEPNINTTVLSNPDSTFVPAMTTQIKDGQFIDVEAEEVIADNIKAKHAQAELVKDQQMVQVESADLILAEQTGSEAQSEQKQQELDKQDKTENIKEERMKEQTEESNEKNNTVQKEAGEPRNVTEGVNRTRIKQSNQVINVEQAEPEKLTEKRTKNEPTNIELDVQKKFIQAQPEQATSPNINTEPVGKKQLGKVQVGTERKEADQNRAVNVEQAGTESRKAEQTNQQIKQRQTKAEPEKTMMSEQEKINTDHGEIQDMGQAKYQGNLVKVDSVKVRQPATLMSSTNETKVEEKIAEEMKQKRIKVEGFKAELTMGEKMEERSAKLTAKLTATQPAKSEPDRVEQVKTELAKAKAELAKIKEKMRGQQKEKVKNPVVIKEDGAAKANVPSKLSLNKNEGCNEVQHEAQIHQPKEILVVGHSSSQPDRGAEEYDRLREKYGFIHAVSTDKTKQSATKNLSSPDNSETQTLPPHKVETVSKENSIDDSSPPSKFTTAHTESKNEVGSFKSNEITGSQYVYSESSKEFKLSCANDPPTDGNKKESSNNVMDNVKDDIVDKMEKNNPVKNNEVSLQKDSESTRVPPPERKTKLSEHSAGPVKDLHFTPPKALSHRERAQTKQEILTSKIRAHAEKEISAIKEKGFAMRDGSKSSSKLLPGAQSVNIRQKPPSQDARKKYESTTSSSVKSKQQMGVTGIQLEPFSNVSPPGSTTAPLKSSATNNQPADLLPKQVSQKTMENNNGVPEPSLKPKQSKSYNVKSANSSAQNEKQENQPENESSPQTKETAPKVEQVKPQIKHEGPPEQQKELEENPSAKNNTLNKKKEGPLETTQAATEKGESKEAHSLNFVFGQKESPVADDSLRMKGIMVTVQDRKPPVDFSQENYSTQNLMNTTEKVCHSNSDLDKKEDPQKTSTSGKHTNNMTGNTTEANDQQEGSSMPKRETKPYQLAEKGVKVSVPVKNRVLAETQPPLSKQDTTARQTKGPADNKCTNADEVKIDEKILQNVQPPHTDGNPIPKVVNHKINNDNATTQMKHGVQPSVTEDTTAVTNQSKISNQDERSVPLLEDERHGSTPPRAFNKASENTLPGIENKDASPKQNESEGVINQEDDDIHIGTIAIRVVPPSNTNGNVKVVGNHQSITSPSEVALPNENKQAASASGKENSNILTYEDPSKSLIKASAEKKMKDSLEDKLGVQPVSVGKVSDLSKTNNQQSIKNEACKNTQLDVGKSDKAKKGDELTIPLVEEDYFQIRAVTETSDEPLRSETVADTPKKRELPEILPNMQAPARESIKESGTNDVFVFKVDQAISKTVDSTSGNLHNESAEGKNCETEEKLASNPTDGSMGRWSNNENKETGQTNHIRKDHTEYKASSSERQSLRSSHPRRENRVKEKPEVKPKPKERTSTIPEISALADYARLKVIVSEEKDVNPVQEFPPNKKEGFFPLIQTRHSRRPVFTLDPPENSVKEKTLPHKTEMTAKVNKEPKALVFPITEKQQRTGMFKLGDKERQDKMFPEDKVMEDMSDNVANHAQDKHRNDLPKAQTEQTAKTGTQRANHVNLTDYQQHNPSSQVTASSDSGNRSQNSSERLTYLDKTSPSHPYMGQMPNEKENLVSPRKGERMEQHKRSKTEAGQKDKLKNQRPATQHEEGKAKEQGQIKQPEEEQTIRKKEDRKEDDMRIKHMLEESRASQAEEERRAIQREEERREREREAIAIKIKEKREKQREAEREEEERQANHKEKQKAAQKEEAVKSSNKREDMKIKQMEAKIEIKAEDESLTKIAENEQKKENEREKLKQQEEQKATQEAQLKQTAQAELQKRAVKEQQKQEEQKRRAAKEENQRIAYQEEHQRRVVHEEQQRKAAQEEQERKAAEEQQRRATQEEQQRRAAQEQQERKAAEEQQRRATQEEQQRRVAQEQQRRAAHEKQQKQVAQEQQRRAAHEEQQKQVAQEQQQRRAAHEEQQKQVAQEQQQRAAHEEQQRRAAQEEQQRRAAQEEQQRRAAKEEQQRRAAQEEQQRRAALEEQKRRAAHEEQQRRAAQEEQQRRDAEQQQRQAAQEEQQRRAAQREQQRISALKEQQRKAAEEEQQREAAREEQQMRAAEEEQQTRARHIEKIIDSNEEERESRRGDDDKATHISQEKIIKQIMEGKAEKQIEDKIHGSQNKEEWIRLQKVEDEKKKIIKQRQEIQTKEQIAMLPENCQAEEREDVSIAQEQMLLQRDEEFQDEQKEEKNVIAQREKVKAAQVEQQRRSAQIDALQYYAITSTQPERKSKERQLYSPSPSQQKHTPPNLESNDRPYRPHAPASPASSLPRSTSSSPALGLKPSMFRVKDNTFKGAPLTKSVKPRFHKNFGEDYWGGEEQEIMRRSAGTPVYPDPGSNRLSAINESSTYRSVSSLDTYSAAASYHRPYSRRSIAIDDDDSRSVFSTTSEGMESFATSAGDLADIRGLYDYDRPESACSFSSDVSRALGKPPTVPPKSEKALRRAQRLTTRRIKKELSKVAENNPDELQKEDPIVRPSSYTEVRSPSRHAVASPHFSQPVSLAHAQTIGSNLAPSHAEHQPSHRSFHASPHATGPISLPNTSAHATAALTLPAAPKTVSHAPSSNTLHHVNHPAPVTQYQLESSYPQSYPLTQRKVLQDLGSGQYFVVDVPVEVKTKTFIDPETGKYVQLNVRESGQSIPRHQPQKTHPQPQFQPQRQIKAQQQPISRASPAGTPAAHHHGYNGYPNNYQPAPINYAQSNSSTPSVTDQQDQQPIVEYNTYGYPAPEAGENKDGRRYSPEKTPYMDTVNDVDKTHNRFYGTRGSYESFPESDTNSQLAGHSVCENDNSAHSQCQPREIITISELEDFMEISDW